MSFNSEITFSFLRKRNGNFVGLTKDGFLSVCNNEEKIRSIILIQLRGKRLNYIIENSDDPRDIKIHGRLFSSKLMPVGIDDGFLLEGLSLFDPLDGKWLTFPSVDTHAPMGELRVDEDLVLSLTANGNADWEELFLEPAQESQLCQFVCDIAKFLNEFAVYEVDAGHILSLLEKGKSDLAKIYIESIYSLISVNEIEVLSKNIFYNDYYFHIFREFFRDDFWLCCINNLKLWYNNRENKDNILCGPDFDWLEDIYLDSDFMSLTHAVSAFCRRNIVPRKRSCVVMTARNEGLYLLEWVAWYKSLGFNDIFLYTNNDTDGSDKILNILADNGIIKWIMNDMKPGTKPQHKVYAHCFSVMPHILDYEWALVVDADEYLSLNNNRCKDINEFITYLSKNESDAVGINWKYVASTDEWDFTQKTLAERCPYYIRDDIIGAANDLIKSFVRPRSTLSYSTHHAVWAERTNFKYRLVQGGTHRYAHNKCGYSDDPMWADYNHHGLATIIHYHYKSPVEFVLKFYKGDATEMLHLEKEPHELIKENWIQTFNYQHKKYGEKVPANRNLPSEQQMRLIQEYKSLPGMREAYDNVVSNSIDMISSMVNYMKNNKERLTDDSKVFLDNLCASDFFI